MNIEQLAVNEVNRLLESCDHLEPLIDANDRTPLTDGHISLYSDTSDNHSKENFLGRVDVQVKGKTLKDPSRLQTYPVDRADLEGYGKMTGVLFFVVAIRRSDKKKQAYYSILSPFTIANILTEMKPSQKRSLFHSGGCPPPPKTSSESWTSPSSEAVRTHNWVLRLSRRRTCEG